MILVRILLPCIFIFFTGADHAALTGTDTKDNSPIAQPLPCKDEDIPRYKSYRATNPPTTPSFYKYVRHPLYLGWMIAFWAAPVMTIAHFLFAAICTGYMLTAIRFEERDLISVFGDKYIRYKQVSLMYVPVVNANTDMKAVKVE